jgi:hypothetical protein
MSNPSGAPRLVKPNLARRRQYGTAHLKLTDKVDVVAPSGSFVQTRGASPPPKPRVSRRRTGSSSPRKSLSPVKSRLPSHITQYQNWVNSTIPTIIPVYMELLQRTNNLKAFSQPSTRLCGCMPTVHRLRVVCALQDRKLPHLQSEMWC